MRPWWHARQSARRRSADWQEDLEIHEFIDSTKIACPDLRHRVVLHNSDLGVWLTEQAFPARNDCAAVVRQHVMEDLGAVPTLGQWMAKGQRPSRLRWREPDDEDVVRSACEHTGLVDASPVRRVLSLLTCAERFLSGQEAFGRGLLMNNFGPYLVRRLMGPPHAIQQEGRKTVMFDAAWIAEGIIIANFGRIPLLSEALAPFTGPAST